ncbi:MAG: fluoride efflux transporter CrcB [Candidatus Rokuibacteriota bacterium]|nr:MAG: fluoride efflux transporter CrcB [Candidatus Rokubacteria bacterium]
MRLLLICLGGAVGTGARYLIGGLAARWLGPEFPYGTLFINVLGSFLIGFIQQVGLTTLAIPETTRLVLTIGVMGGLTTYSSFSYETIRLIENGSWLGAAANIVLTTCLCLVVCVLGLGLGRVVVGWKGGL